VVSKPSTIKSPNSFKTLFVLLGLETKLISGGVVSLLAGRRNPDLAAQDPKTLRIVEKIPSLCLSLTGRLCPKFGQFSALFGRERA
jgi:hypothetical protein